LCWFCFVSVFRSWPGLLQLCLLARNKPNSTRRLALQIALRPGLWQETLLNSS
jgi:hypothetical protein